jgi:hypothetical protein
MNKDVISDRIKKRRAVFMSTFDDAPPEAKQEMILKLYWNNAIDAAKVLFGGIDANVRSASTGNLCNPNSSSLSTN